jgi:predicted house-cleaning noncanonical NTP pyrophosphatase (MazG superfamily)
MTLTRRDTRNLTIALRRHINEVIRKGRANLVKENAAKQAFKTALETRINKMMVEMRKQRKDEALQEYLTAKGEMRETWGDLARESQWLGRLRPIRM